jgi:aspartyl-tRNA(Asn)/glutamyl-tRNA(Gln) amidotransferase subunit B
MIYAGISDCKMEEGSMRCDANISLRKVGDTKLNTRVELKNINSFKELEKALTKEQKRQLELYKYGEEHKIVQETRRWDAAKGKTIPMRSKEDAHDYRYFPEPDVIPIVVKDEIVENAKATMPELPQVKLARFVSEYKLNETDAAILVDERALAEFYEKVVEAGADAKSACNWVLRDIIRLMHEQKITTEEITFDPKELAEIIKMAKAGTINSSAATQVFDEIVKTGKTAKVIVEEKGLIQVNDSSEIEKIVEDVLANNSKVVEQFKGGNTKVKGFLVGQVMKMSKGKANPKMASDMIDAKLAE